MSKGSRRKRRDQWGSVTYDAKRQVGYIRYWASIDERGYMRHCKTVHGTRQEVEEERARLLIAHGKEKPVPNVKYVWDTWCLPDLKNLVSNGDMAPLTLRSYEKSWRLYIKPRWATTALDQVRPLQIQQWILTMGASPAEQAISAMSRIMDYAVRYELVQHNPMREKYLMPSKSTIVRADKECGSYRSCAAFGSASTACGGSQRSCLPRSAGAGLASRLRRLLVTLS